MKNTYGMSVYSKEYTFPMLLLLLSDSYYSKTWLNQNYKLKFHDILNFSSYLTSQGRNEYSYKFTWLFQEHWYFVIQKKR
jgi:hypothetical protein